MTCLYFLFYVTLYMLFSHFKDKFSKKVKTFFDIVMIVNKRKVKLLNTPQYMIYAKDIMLCFIFISPFS